jgi:hypothetical protein
VDPRTLRILPIALPEQYELPARSEAGAGDAYRQTQFVLGEDLSLFAEAMNLQLAIARDAFPFSRLRTPALAAMSGLWSRAYLYLGDALLLTLRGSYPGALPLVRSACEMIGAEEALRAGEMEEHDRWLERALHPNDAFKAIDFEMGRYFAGNTLASDAVLGAVYRPSGDLARVHFGATLLQAGPESSSTRLALAFADRSFHLGWAELVLGWLLTLAVRQIGVIVAAEDTFPVTAALMDDYADLQSRASARLARDDRCSLAEVMEGNDRRYLIANFRRAAGAAPRKVLL